MEQQAERWIGRAMPRREDARLLCGAGRFVDDIAPEGCLHLEFLRSPYPCGRIAVLDIDAAREAEGVAAVFTGADLAGLGASAVNPLLPGASVAPMRPLADGRVAAVGQPVAAVVAASRALARDGAEAIGLEIEEEGAGETPAVSHRWAAGEAPEVGLRVSAAVDHALVAPFALEPRAALAVWEGGALTVWLSTQTPQRCRDDLAAMLGLARAAVRVIAPDVGGAFGGKASLMPEDLVCAFAARRLGGAVKWCASRSEEFQAATQGRGARTRGEIAVGGGGRVLFLRADLAFPLGHWTPYSSLAPARNAGRMLPGPYDVAAVDTRLAAHLTCGAAVNIYRGAGRPEATILMERLMDKGAAALGMDPLAFRRANLLPPLEAPHETASGALLCSGDFGALLDRLEAKSDYAAARAAQGRARAAGAVRGIGAALYVEPCGQGWESAEARLMADGGLILVTGSSAQGQGRETAFAQIVAAELGVRPDAVRVIEGDTGEAPEGIGALASRSTGIGGTAALLAARALADMAREAAAPLLNAGAAQVALGPEGFAAPHGATLGWADLAARLGGAGAVLRAPVRYEAPAEAWASGAVLAEVDICPDTGAATIARIVWIDDAGTIINPMLVEGQLIGGMAQGVGTALMERVVYEGGQLMTGSLMDYALPRAADMPPVRIVKQSTPSPANRLGAKGVGEAGCIGVPAAILNAVQDALAPFGAPDLQFPLTSEKLWRAMTGQNQ